MGRKKGQQQRTKGNVLPSSSVRSADLLAKESVSSNLGFVQSAAFVGIGNVPELAGLDAIANNEFRTVLKKLQKRDVTTKLKALTEFSSLCSSCKQHEVLTVLPFWPRIYNRLFEDSDRRVRENSQKAMYALATAVGKNLALQLKNVMGCWFLSQCDTYAPSALEAEASLVQTFAGEKKVEAFIFCRTEILKNIAHYLFGPQARKEKTSEENNYHRIMASCIAGLSLFIHTVVSRIPVAGEIEEFLDEKRFWKLQKHSSVSVRGGFYSVIEALCMVCSDMLNPHLGEVCKSVFHRLDESSITVNKHLYAAAVALVTKCDSWHQEVDIQKGVIPGLCSILRSGCHGLGASVLPSLLPILVKIPSSVDLLAMFSKIFEAMKECLNHEKVKLSKHGSELAISVYFEIQLLSVSRIVNEVNDGNAKERLLNAVLNQNILYLLEESFAGRCNKSSVGRIYSQLSVTIHAWDRKIDIAESDKIYCQLCERFWVAVDSMIGQYAFKAGDLFQTKLIVQFLNEMLYYNSQMKPGQASVKFGTVSSVPKVASVVSMSSSQRVQSSVNNISAGKLLAFPWDGSKETISVYKDIVQKIGNRGLFVTIFNQSGILQEKEGTDVVSVVIEEVLLKEIRRIVGCTECPELNLLEILSDIIFFSVRHCKSTEVFPISETLLLETDVMKPWFAVSLHFVFTLESYADSDPVIATWLYNLLLGSNDCAWSFLKSVANHISKCRCSFGTQTNFIDVEKGWKLIKAFMTKSFSMTHGVRNHLCDQDSFTSIAKTLLSGVESSKACKNCYPSLLSRTCAILLTCLKTGRNLDMTPLNEGGQTLWLRLMTELLRTHCFSEAASSDVLSCLSELLMCIALEESPISESSSVDVAHYLKSQAGWLRENLLSLSLPCFSEVVNNFKTLLSVVFEISYAAGCAFIENLLPSVAEWEAARGPYREVISAGDESLLDDSELDVFKSSRYFKLICFFQELICETDFQSSGEDELKLWELEPLLAFGKEVIIAATLVSDSELIGTFSAALGPNFDSSLRSAILSMSMKRGGIWACCVRFLGPQYRQEEWHVILEKFIISCESSISLEISQTMIVALEFIPADKFNLAKFVSQLHAVEPETISESDVYLFAFIVAVLGMDLQGNKDSVSETLDIVIEWRRKKDNLFAFEEDLLTKADFPIVHLNSSVAQLFAHSVKILAESLSESQWDFILCALLSWFEGISRLFEEVFKKIPIVMLLRNCCVLLQEVNAFMLSPIAKEDPTVPNSLLREWSEFFSSQINTSIVKIFLSTNFCMLPISYSKNVMKCVQYASAKSIIAVGSELKPKLSPDCTLPPETQTVINYLCPLLHTETGTPLRQVLVIGTAYILLNSLLESMVENVTSSPPDVIFSALKRLSKDIESLFVAVDEDTVKSPPPDSEESDDSEAEEERDDAGELFRMKILDHAPAVLGHFLSWKLLINLTRFVTAEKKSLYIDSLMKGNGINLTEDLLPKIFKIMIGKKSFFKSSPQLIFEGGFQFENLEHIVASLYRDFLVQMPAASRTWFNDLSKAVRSRVDKFTSIHVSPVLIEEEFRAVQITKQQQAVEGMEIIARPGAREVHATYKLNEIEMEIAVCLSANHPLGPINVKTEKRAGVVMGQWRYWILQITMFLQYQNGGIIDGLLLWKDKVDKRFEGVEECMICFSVVHGSSQSLPKLKCKTCKKKYHAECLYKWFDTSNNSTCPLCRSPMIFR